MLNAILAINYRVPVVTKSSSSISINNIQKCICRLVCTAILREKILKAKWAQKLGDENVLQKLLTFQRNLFIKAEMSDILLNASNTIAFFYKDRFQFKYVFWILNLML